MVKNRPNPKATPIAAPAPKHPTLASVRTEPRQTAETVSAQPDRRASGTPLAATDTALLPAGFLVGLLGLAALLFAVALTPARAFGGGSFSLTVESHQLDAVLCGLVLLGATALIYALAYSPL